MVLRLLESLRYFLNKHLTCTERLQACMDDVVLLREENMEVHSLNIRQEEIIESLGRELKREREREDDPVPKEDPLKGYADYWNSKHPVKNISYHGRYMPNLKEGAFLRKKLEIDVRLFVQPNDWVINVDIKNNNLEVKDPLRCNDDILRIYKHTRTKPLNPYRYVYDEPNVGVSEFWYFPHELRQAKKGDCDDWGNELASYLIAAGVPPFRVRCVAGDTYGGGGHLTVYVLGDDMETWYHINSTTPISMIRAKKLEELPKAWDENDKIGIKEVWFSYNNELSWHVFATDAAESSYKKRDGFLKFITIN